MPPSIAFFINSIIQRKNEIVRQIHLAFGSGIDYHFYESEYAAHHLELVPQAVRSGRHTHFIAVGGDGSFNEVVNGLLSAVRKPDVATDAPMKERFDWDTLRGLHVGVCPAGTGNDFVKNFPTPFTYAHLRELIETDQTRPLDLCHATFSDATEQPTERFFMNIADVGMGGTTVQLLSQNARRYLRPTLAYNQAIIQTFFRYKKADVHVHNASLRWHGKSMAVVVANGKYFGSGLGIAPNAEVDNGKLQLVILGNISLLDYAINLPTVMRCKRLKHREVSYHLVDNVTIDSAKARRLPIDMDGEFVGYAPMRVQKLAQVLSFIADEKPSEKNE